MYLLQYATRFHFKSGSSLKRSKIFGLEFLIAFKFPKVVYVGLAGIKKNFIKSINIPRSFSNITLFIKSYAVKRFAPLFIGLKNFVVLGLQFFQFQSSLNFFQTQFKNYWNPDFPF